MIDRDLTRTTPAERTRLWRRREGLTQVAAAARFGVGKTGFISFETGHPSSARARFPVPAIRPDVSELLGLARRRSGLGLRATARAVGVSHRTVLIWERRADPRLVAFWSRRGFRFP